MKSGYVFGMHLNFDPGLTGELVNQEALVSGDTTLAPPFRRYARVWLNVDYQRAMVTAHRRRHVRALGQRRAGGALVVVADKNGLAALSAPVVIDCTADADVAASAGAECLKGDPEDGRLMHVNFMYEIVGADREQYAARQPATDDLLAMIAAAHASGELIAPPGCFRPRAATFPYHPDEDCLVLTSWEIEGVDCSDWAAVNALLGQCQVAALQVVRFARAHLPGYEHCGVGRVWDVLGTRESRRLVGQATLTGEDVLAARKFPDGIAQATFFIDFHDSPPGRSIPYTQDFRVSHAPPLGDWYEIPYGCLVPRRVTGLLVAGRCISTTHEAMAAIRVMSTCMAMGEAAGRAAVMAVREEVAPSDIDVRRLREELVESGAYLRG